ncbi:MAG: hypothetical protein ACI95X_000746, partial [Paraglaciecola sp.]
CSRISIMCCPTKPVAPNTATSKDRDIKRNSYIDLLKNNF